jgi:hypothetical protein
VGPRAVLDAVVKRKIPSPRRDSNPRTLIIQFVAQRHTSELSRPVPRSNNEWSYTFIPPYAFMEWCSVNKKHRDNFTFTLHLLEIQEIILIPAMTASR